MKKMTDWFPSSIKPIRAGVYEVFTPNSSANTHSYYDKKGWRLCGSSAHEAEDQIMDLQDLHESSMTVPGAMWREFKEPQQ